MPGVSLGITLPTVGATVGPDYATQVNAAIQALVDDVEAKIVPSEIVINEDLSFRYQGVSYSATDLKRVGLNAQGVVLTAGSINSLYSLNGELYFQDGSGNDVAMTSSGNVAGAAGNIGTSGSPAYATSGVEVLWVGGDLEYRLKSGSGANDFADAVLAQVDFHNGSVSTTMGRASGGSSYTLTWPNAGPSADDLATFDGSGNVTFGKTLGGNYSVTGTLGVGGKLTLSADDAHGDRVLILHQYAGIGFTTAGGIYDGYAIDGSFDMEGYFLFGAAGYPLAFPIPLKVGDRIKSIDFYFQASGTANRRFALFYGQYAGRTTVDEDVQSYAAGNHAHTLTVTTPTAITAGNGWWTQFRAGNTNDLISHIEVTYDRP